MSLDPYPSPFLVPVEFKVGELAGRRAVVNLVVYQELAQDTPGTAGDLVERLDRLAAGIVEGDVDRATLYALPWNDLATGMAEIAAAITGHTGRLQSAMGHHRPTGGRG